ncbi:hypothetical protein E2C01_050537 [Portunus trituberculatus]|uniref:Uncharacterized protein n=1 Tax=Portunus trituberculatus TaxID=210409 RepID=A0A5B7GG92_PORTR|nr:hypothetical protein [Portunus trituberculatus]
MHIYDKLQHKSAEWPLPTTAAEDDHGGTQQAFLPLLSPPTAAPWSSHALPLARSIHGSTGRL